MRGAVLLLPLILGACTPALQAAFGGEGAVRSMSEYDLCRPANSGAIGWDRIRGEIRRRNLDCDKYQADYDAEAENNRRAAYAMMGSSMMRMPTPSYTPSYTPPATAMPQVPAVAAPSAQFVVPSAAAAPQQPARFFPSLNPTNVTAELLRPYAQSCAGRSLPANHGDRARCDQLYNVINRVMNAQPQQQAGVVAPSPPTSAPAYTPPAVQPRLPAAAVQPSPAPATPIYTPTPAATPPRPVNLAGCIALRDQDKGNSIDVTAYNNCSVPATVVVHMERRVANFGISCNAFDVRPGSSWTVNFMNPEKAAFTYRSRYCDVNARCTC